ncbi:8-hydroxy-dADP phosphatase [Balamuthia mandrillaris]
MEGDVEEGALQQPQAALRGRRPPRLLFLAGGRSNELTGEASSLLVAMEGLGLPLVEAVRQADERTFIAVHSWTAANSAHTRLACFDKGANMVTASTSDLLSTLTVIAAQGTNNNNETVYQCPTCGLENLTAFQLYAHHPLYHVNPTPQPSALSAPTRGTKRKSGADSLYICSMSTPRLEHISKTRLSHVNLAKLILFHQIQTSNILSLDICICVGETGEAAIRETKEEAGIDIELTGVLRIECLQIKVVEIGSPGRTLKRDACVQALASSVLCADEYHEEKEEQEEQEENFDEENKNEVDSASSSW